MNGYPSFYPRIALVAPSPGDKGPKLSGFATSQTAAAGALGYTQN